MIKKEKNTTNSSIEEKKFKDVTLQSERQNWEQRILNEMESPHKWRETWGELFQSEVPFEYEAKIKYLEQELKKFDVNSLTTIHKHGLNQSLKEIAPAKYGRKKLFYEDTD